MQWRGAARGSLGDNRTRRPRGDDGRVSRMRERALFPLGRRANTGGARTDNESCHAAAVRTAHARAE